MIIKTLVDRDFDSSEFEKKSLGIRIKTGKIDAGFAEGLLVSDSVVSVFIEAYGKNVYSGKEVDLRNAKFDWEKLIKRDTKRNNWYLFVALSFYTVAKGQGLIIQFQ